MEWISTKYEMPNKIGEKVLIYPIDGEIEVAKYIGEGIYLWYDYTISGVGFTHWQPLPEPPKED